VRLRLVLGEVLLVGLRRVEGRRGRLAPAAQRAEREQQHDRPRDREQESDEPEEEDSPPSFFLLPDPLP
ncbi:MAG TPA: hypothetical protein VM204_08120, partial [Gaiellaceae bacterium]|nr:hypothetical protein [Gaiellaceae bacterium]